jgi:hypothetical protein
MPVKHLIHPPYTMAATGFKPAELKAMRTATTEPIKESAWIHTNVNRIALCGPPKEKGCGIEDPEAIEGGIKAASLLRQLNTVGHAEEITADLLKKHRRGERKWTPPVICRGIEATQRHPIGGTPWLIAENFADLGSDLLIDICPEMQKHCNKARWKTLAESKIGDTLLCAQQPTQSEPMAARDADINDLSPAEQAILQGTQVPGLGTCNLLEDLLTAEAIASIK